MVDGVIIDAQLVSFDPATGNCQFSVDESQIPQQAPSAPGEDGPQSRIVVEPGGDIQAAILEAESGELRRVEVLGGSYPISEPIVLRGPKVQIDMHRNAEIVYPGTGYAVELINARDCDIRLGSILCTHQDGSGILVDQQGSTPGTNDSTRCLIHGGQILNAGGRRPVKPALTGLKSHGIHFRHSGNSGVANYFHNVERTRIKNFDTDVLCDEGANANVLTALSYERAWYPLVLLSDECQVLGGFWHKTAGVNASNRVECIRIGDASRGINGQFHSMSGLAMEPAGGNAYPLWIDAGSKKNVIMFTRNIADLGNQLHEPDNVVIDQTGVHGA